MYAGSWRGAQPTSGARIRAFCLLQAAHTPAVSLVAGIRGPSFGGRPIEHATAGATWGDYDRDGDPDFFVSFVKIPPQTIRYKAVLWTNQRDGTFRNETFQVNLAYWEYSAPGAIVVDWGMAAADFDEDGQLELAVVNGGRATDPTIVREPDRAPVGSVAERLCADRRGARFIGSDAARGSAAMWALLEARSTGPDLARTSQPQLVLRGRANRRREIERDPPLLASPALVASMPSLWTPHPGTGFILPQGGRDGQEPAILRPGHE